MTSLSRYPLPPPPFEEFESNYRSLFPDQTHHDGSLAVPSSALYRPVDAPRITPPPPSSLFATSESESLANFLDDFQDNTDFLFQPALASGLPEFGMLPGPDPYMGEPSLPLQSLERTMELPESQPPSPKRYKVEVASPAAFVEPSTAYAPPGMMEGVSEQQHDTTSEAETHRSRQASRQSMVTSATSPTASASSHASTDARAAAIKAKALLTEEEKRSNHIQSEQKRRNAIRDGFAELVTILQTGEQYSGLSIGYDGGDDGSGRKPRGRGRGRKGDHSAGASKSVVLSQAVKYVHWLQRGNLALEAEVARLELMLGMA